MPDPIVYVDTSSIRAGKLDELKAAMKELATEPPRAAPPSGNPFDRSAP